MPTTTTSKQYTLNLKDGLRGLLMAVLGAVLTALYPVVSGGSFDFNWKSIAAGAVTTAIAYLLKNFFTPTEVVITKVPDEVVNQVKKGTADVNIQSNRLS
jgi:hypothetical protein